MKYSNEEVIQYAEEEDVKFIRLAFCDVFGRQKNISIMPEELPRAFEYGIAIDASAIPGFGEEPHSDLFLHPESETLMRLPWRPEHGKVVQMFSNITNPDGTPFECDTRGLLKQSVNAAAKDGHDLSFGAEIEFYLFELDEFGKPTKTPCDEAGYMDVAPDDHGENVRREICLTLEQMGISPVSSHHKEGPGQNEINFKLSDALTAADNAIMFERVVKTVAYRNGMYADFSPKPLSGFSGNGFHIHMSAPKNASTKVFEPMLAGILDNIYDITAFLNPSEDSYKRLGNSKAPGYISWSPENRSQLIRVPAASGNELRAELRSPDPGVNPYLAFALVLFSALDGIEKKAVLPSPANINFFTAGEDMLSKFKKLPESLLEARLAASRSDFVKKNIPQKLIDIYCK